VSPRKNTDDEATSGVGMDALGDEARESVEAAIKEERAEDQPNVRAGMPSESEFVTPRQNQGQAKR
jgi:hypothetical protein